ncbi:FadR/GntR family transcriptional regulator [Burkholderia plantarii]|uniref:FadR/GntR family transcriptional regulator n=1 Tax=Burkholderia plantarii TaxID=41899 RepID=UPI0006D8C006|nr:FadR/GntR family transcriptional regulator [Burkholderia plantarii]ALK35268.1 GntR family transcriptional regulator [Burkholderia plantarii]WLE64229.1 FadR family transcriptional regulator [Burkholderia plantarii]GLZ23237.1 transcriptional regulator [Burkholderia plantarii]
MELTSAATREATPRSELVGKMLAFFKERGFESGERLPSERALAERFGVGRNALREALSTLSALRVIESRPNSGIYLRRMSTDSSFETIVLLTEMGSEPSMREVKETLEVRWALELRAVQLACERRTEADLDGLMAIIDATNAVLANEGNISVQDTAFHMALARCTHNEVLVRLLNSFYRISESRRFALFADTTRGEVSAGHHAKLYEAVKKRDAKKAVTLMEKHFSSAVDAWNEILGDEEGPAAAKPAKSRAKRVARQAD